MGAILYNVGAAVVEGNVHVHHQIRVNFFASTSADSFLFFFAILQVRCQHLPKDLAQRYFDLPLAVLSTEGLVSCALCPPDKLRPGIFTNPRFKNHV